MIDSGDISVIRQLKKWNRDPYLWKARASLVPFAQDRRQAVMIDRLPGRQRRGLGLRVGTIRLRPCRLARQQGGSEDTGAYPTEDCSIRPDQIE